MRTRDENKVQAIRQKTIQQIARYGLDGFSIQKLAKAAGVSPATIYIYYKDKETLILQIAIELIDEMLAASLKDFNTDMHFEEGLKVQWRNRAAHFVKYPLETQFMEHIRYAPIYDKVREVVAKKFSDVMGKFVQNAIRNKEVVKLPFEVYWSIAFAPLYQLIKFHTQGKGFKGTEFVMTDKIMMQACELVTKALRP